MSLPNLDDRLETAAKARSATLARFRARPGTDDPAVLARASARRAIVDARAGRETERRLQREADLARDEALREAERLAEAEREVARRAAEVERAKARQIELKTQRDARYLARKAKAQAKR